MIVLILSQLGPRAGGCTQGNSPGRRMAITQGRTGFCERNKGGLYERLYPYVV
jgi:hypothetical protein